MKRGLLFSLLSLMLLCSACQAAESPPLTPDLEQPSQVAPDNLNLSETEPLLPLILPEQRELPASITPSAREPAILPLTNSPQIYQSCIIGEVAFVDLTGARIPLPSGVTEYYAVYDQVRGGVSGYALLNVEGKYALMDTQGNLVNDFRYNPYDPADGYYFFGAYDYAVTSQVAKTGGYALFFGLYDLQTGQEILPPEYNNINCYANHIIARQGNMEHIVDYQGNLLFSNDRDIYVLYAGDDPYFGSAGYYYREDSGELFYYETSHQLLQHGDLQLVYDYEDSRPFSLYNRQGQHLYSGSLIGYYLQDEQILLCAEGEVWVFDPTGAVDHFRGLAIDVNRTPDDMRYEDGFLAFRFARDGGWQEIYYDRQGQELGRENVDLDNYQRGNLTIRFEPYSQQLTDDDGKILIPFDRYQYIGVSEPFIIGHVAVTSMSRDSRFDILNAQGEVLLHNPLGATFRQGVAGDSMIVWLDEETCILLHSDGSQQPIADPPAVELVYYGG